MLTQLVFATQTPTATTAASAAPSTVTATNTPGRPYDAAFPSGATARTVDSPYRPGTKPVSLLTSATSPTEIHSLCKRWPVGLATNPTSENSFCNCWTYL